MAQEWHSTQLEIEATEDLIEACYENGWTDGLPVVPPTPERVARMLSGTDLNPEELIAAVPPKWGRATIEKVAINAVMAGCKPAYLPLILTAVKAMTDEQFNLHGVQVTTSHVGPMLIVNGPIRKQLEINDGFNLFGQGWRANATIGRALRLICTNIGGALPGELDRAAFGHAGKYTCCIAEKEEASPWMPYMLTADSNQMIALLPSLRLPVRKLSTTTGATPLKASLRQSPRTSLPRATAAAKRCSLLVLNTRRQSPKTVSVKPTSGVISLTPHSGTRQKTYL